MAKDKWKNLKNAKFMKIADQEAAGEAAKEVSEAERGGRSRRRTVACTEISTRYLYRRAFSELSLLDATPPLRDGYSYHFITAGDVDALSFLELILRQQSLEHLYFSTWCIHAEDLLQIEEFLEDGRVKTMDAYVGEIFPNQYRIEWQMLHDLFARRQCGELKVFRNHSKIMGGYGDKFYFVAETSANINTNPRTEHACITLDRGLYEFYREYFNGIKSFM